MEYEWQEDCKRKIRERNRDDHGLDRDLAKRLTCFQAKSRVEIFAPKITNLSGASELFGPNFIIIFHI